MEQTPGWHGVVNDTVLDVDEVLDVNEASITLGTIRSAPAPVVQADGDAEGDADGEAPPHVIRAEASRCQPKTAAALRSLNDVLMSGRPKLKGVRACQGEAPVNALQQLMHTAKTQVRGGAKRGSNVSGAACAPWVTQRGCGPVRLVEVPYSEHSSCEELQEFVAWLRPRAVVPTVGGGRDATVRMQRVLAGAETPL